MAEMITYYNDPQAKVKRVYYEGSDTVYEGMALCYNWDTTDNITGYEYADSAETGTTAEGNHNEGKYIRVEKPATLNFPFFAGVVAGTEREGTTGPCWLDIFTPNGAIVPVRGTDNTTAKNNLYLGNSDYELTTTASDGALVAIAIESVNLATTEGLVLAKLLDSSTSLEAARLDSLETLTSDAFADASNNASDIAVVNSDFTVRCDSIETIASDAFADASDNVIRLDSIETVASDAGTAASDNVIRLDSIETVASDAGTAASDNVIRLDSIETIASDALADASDNVIRLDSIETVASDAGTAASDNVIRLDSIETVASDAGAAASDNVIRLDSIETLASDNAYSITHYLSDAWVAFSNAAPAATGAAVDSVSSLASDLNTRMSDLAVAISDWFVVMSDAGLV